MKRVRFIYRRFSVLFMGRIKTKLVKRTGEELVKSNGDMFSQNFEDNKKSLPNIASINSKKLRNVIAGYIIRLVKRKQK